MECVQAERSTKNPEHVPERHVRPEFSGATVGQEIEQSTGSAIHLPRKEVVARVK